jgi:uncharacterized protein (TIGR02145 family)
MKKNLGIIAIFLVSLVFTISCEGKKKITETVSDNDDTLNYEGKEYKTVKIGNQIWMAENLNYNVNGSKCYDNDPANCEKYGRLYDWATAMGLDSNCNSRYNCELSAKSGVGPDSSCNFNICANQIQPKHRGVCPSGWHLPNNEDWNKLYRYIDDTSSTENSCDANPIVGTKLKSKNGWTEFEGNSSNGTDDFRFSALPGGGGNSYFEDCYIGYVGIWWSSSNENSKCYPYSQWVYFNYEYAYLVNCDSSFLFSVRCMKD